MSVRPDIIYTGIRGNVETRLRKLDNGDIDAIVLAAAGLKRLGLESRISRFLETDMVLPAPCQGALGVEFSVDDNETRELLERIDNPDVRICVDTERAFIAALGMGCHTPVGALARTDRDGIIFSGYVHNENGRILRRTIHISKQNARNAVRDLALQFRVQR